MWQSARLLFWAAVLAAQGCISSSVVLQVHGDGRGKAVVTSRVFVSGIGNVDRAFGTPVRITASTFESAPDGGIRATTIEFDDLKKLRLAFPLDFSVPGHTTFYMSGIGNDGVITFGVRPHENGDEMPQTQAPPDTEIY